MQNKTNKIRIILGMVTMLWVMGCGETEASFMNMQVNFGYGTATDFTAYERPAHRLQSGLNTSHGVVEFDSVTGLETYVVAQTKDQRSISF